MYKWCVHFPPLNRCSRRSSSPGRVSPRFHPPCKRCQLHYHSSAPLTGKDRKRWILHSSCYFNIPWPNPVPKAIILLWYLTNRFACPFPFPIAQADTLQHVISSVMRPHPSVSNLVRLSSFMATIYKRKKKKKRHKKNKAQRHFYIACGLGNALLTRNSAADFPSARANARAVPDHPILRSFVGFSNPVWPSIYFVITSLLSWSKKKKIERKKRKERNYQHLQLQTLTWHTEIHRNMLLHDTSKMKLPSGFVLHLIPATPWHVHSSTVPR